MAEMAEAIPQARRGYFKHLKRTLIGRIVGKPYKQWKYGIVEPPPAED
ncbi:MAG: hypothetical protein JSR99_15480 [Proteobacteria bacterium]|nr:hypothetical protein [Pseudomonadota bacterium]